MCRRGAASSTSGWLLCWWRQNIGNGRVVVNICDEHRRSVVEAHVVRPVQLPKILETRRVVQDTKRIRLTALARAVVHHSNARLQCMHARALGRWILQTKFAV